MPTTCAASECKNNSKKDNQVTFHRFPADPKRRAEWLKHLNRENFFPTLHTFLCSKHFEEACFDRTGQTVRLRANAVPTIFIYPEHMKEKISCLKVTSIAKPEEPLPQSSTISQKPTDPCPDHNYCLPSPAAIKKKICELERKLEMAHKKIKIYQQRERRVKKKGSGENVDGSELKETGGKNSWDVF